MTEPADNGSLLSGTFANIGGDLLLAPERLIVVLGLGFFVGLAFEEFFSRSRLKPPGGVRTFPLLALCTAFSGAVGSERAGGGGSACCGSACCCSASCRIS